MKNIVIFYIIPKIILLGILLVILPIIFDQSYFKFEDYPVYKKCLDWSANPFFGYLVCLINSENIENYIAIILAISLNSLRDFGFIYLAKNLLTINGNRLYYLLLALHPYLTLYHAKLTTSTFAGLGVLLIFYIIKNKIKINILHYLFSLILIGFRQSQILMFLYFYSVYWFQNMKNYKFNTFYILCFLTALIFLMSLSSVDYFNKVIRLSSEYPTNINISNYYNIDNYYINIILSKGTQILIHIFLLLGFREKAYTEFPQMFISGHFIDIIQIVIGLILIVIHVLGIYGLYKYKMKKNILYFSFLFYLFPTVIVTGHLRYLLPIIPIIMLGLTFLINKKLEKYFVKIT